MVNERPREYICRFLIFVLAALITVGAPSWAAAGKLDDFEKDSTREHHDRESKREHKDERHADTETGNSIEEDFLGFFFEVLFDAMSAGGAISMKRVVPDEAGSAEGIVPRKYGEALLPFARIDVSYQNVESDVGAWDWRGEAGFGPVAFQIRSTRYDENDPPDELKTFQFHLLYRMSLGSYVELDAGVGSLFITGKEEHSGFSVTFPLLFHPTEQYGFEIRPAWSAINENDIQDIDLSVLGGWRYCSIRAGYRWFRSDKQSLDGPFIGLSLRW